jgi:hypothetical protein
MSKTARHNCVSLPTVYVVPAELAGRVVTYKGANKKIQLQCNTTVHSQFIMALIGERCMEHAGAHPDMVLVHFQWGMLCTA